MKTKLKGLCVCSGISAPTRAFKDIDIEMTGYAEVDPFASAVLKNHYPNVPNYGDITKFKEWKNVERPDVIIGGTPCQSFSIAGLRKGLEDPRGNLTLTFIGLLDYFKPTWFVWENVQGVFSTNKGRDFHSFIEGLQAIGYSLSWRVLDAQYFGVPQRRKRVFVVGQRSEDWRSAYEVLFEPESLPRNLKKSRQKGKEVTRKTGTSTTANDRWKEGVNAFDRQRIAEYGNGKNASTVCARDYKDATDLIAIQGNLIASDKPKIKATIRRLTPAECERLQGFPDDFTKIPWRNKPKEECPDGQRYKVLGNSMAVPVVAWIGKRLINVHNKWEGYYV